MTRLVKLFKQEIVQPNSSSKTLAKLYRMQYSIRKLQIQSRRLHIVITRQKLNKNIQNWNHVVEVLFKKALTHQQRLNLINIKYTFLVLKKSNFFDMSILHRLRHLLGNILTSNYERKTYLNNYHFGE